MPRIAETDGDCPTTLPPTHKRGLFAVKHPTNSEEFRGWQHCREVIQAQFQRDTHKALWFAIGNNDLSFIVELLDWVEKTLCINKEPMIIYRTQRKGVILVEPGPFWISTEMRKNLFTLFLRVAFIYASQGDARSIESAMQHYKYSRDTREALERFLLGFTNYVGPEVKNDRTCYHITDGWHSTFLGLKKPRINEYLTVDGDAW